MTNEDVTPDLLFRGSLTVSVRMSAIILRAEYPVGMGDDKADTGGSPGPG